ncbi:endo-1,4-B-xylanase B [Mycena maculata]|uniref:Endo-1,4-beta-xylanase n=1 Tax=Mycena maculata TaxID=230809 RepID=A0AAD7JBY0_9AGAR|nr:endo-1,4-B-xylanase B [Mycena maculata]
MILLSVIFSLWAFTVAAAFVNPTNIARSGSTNSSGVLFGYYYSIIADDGDAVTVADMEDGFYTIQWTDNTGHFAVGVGYNPGSAQTISFSIGAGEGSSYVSVYGWTTDPLIEYRIVEQIYGGVDPSIGLTWKGNLTSDGSVYDVYEAKIVDAPSIVGVANFTQYWSIRQDIRNYAVVTTGNHFAGWAAAGMQLGAFGYQIVATEGPNSSNNGSVAFVQVESAPAGSCAQEYAQCGGQTWTGTTCCVSNTTCVVDNAYFSTCLSDL